MQALNLPTFDYKLKTIEGKTHIFDSIRRKYVVLTPEEWVRQHFIHWLIDGLGYPKGRVSIERGGSYQKGVAKRTDILVYNEQGAVELLIELKAASVPLNRDVLAQLSAYNKMYQARYLIISNGMDTYCFRPDHAGGIEFLESIPSY